MYASITFEIWIFFEFFILKFIFLDYKTIGICHTYSENVYT